MENSSLVAFVVGDKNYAVVRRVCVFLRNLYGIVANNGLTNQPTWRPGADEVGQNFRDFF